MRSDDSSTALVFGLDRQTSPNGVAALVPPIPPGVRVLVADDDHRIRRAVVSSLVRQGFEVREAEDGAPAIELGPLAEDLARSAPPVKNRLKPPAAA